MIKKNIILIGFMGCGKSTIGKKVSVNIGCKFLDTDLKIQNDMNMTINEIFEKYGEPYFRKLEKDLCKKASLNAPMVIATGGGIIKDPENIDFLKTNGIFIYLKSSSEKIYKNIKNDNSRPLLNVKNKKEKINELLEQRIPLYEKSADITVDISNIEIPEITSCITDIINNMEKI